MKRWWSLLLLLPVWLSATSVYLVNDSAVPLRAIVRGNDGTYLGEVVVNAQSSNTWSDGGDRAGGLEQFPRSRTPYTVTWYCMEGSVFSVAGGLATGATATALTGIGVRACKPKKIAPNDKQPEGYLHQGLPGSGGPQTPPPEQQGPSS